MTTQTAPTVDERPVCQPTDSTADQTLIDAVHALTDARDTIERLTGQDASLGALGTLIATIDTVRADLDRAKTTMIEAAAKQPHEKETIIPGVGVLAFTYKNNKHTWDDTLVRDALLDAAKIDYRTGQVNDTADPHTLMMLLTKCARLDWRVTALNEHVPDLDMAEARHTVKGSLTARIIT